MLDDTKKHIDTPKVKTIRVNLNLEVDDHKLLRMWCITNGMTIQQGLTKMVKDWLARGMT
jgi:ParG